LRACRVASELKLKDPLHLSVISPAFSFLALVGAWWATLIAAASSVLDEVQRRSPGIKMLFNTAQRALAVSAAAAVYHALGGELPPSYLSSSASLASESVQRDLGLYFVFASVYFLVNSAAVTVAVALNSGRTYREVWNLNTRGVLVYDLSASVVGILVAWFYVRSEDWIGFGSFGLLGVVIPVIAVRHVYGLYHQLEDSGQELLQVMVKAIEARDPYTSGHSVRVSEMSRAMAAELGLPARSIDEVETAALLHDVGKIHEEFAPLLRKEGRLTEEETALMQTHSAKSAALVGIIARFHGFIRDSVRHHHERWDGLGYPDEVAGKSIPLGARIILIADTIDAMTTDRPYRKRLPVEAVITELQKCRGTQFDPELIDVVVGSVSIRRLIEGVASPPSSEAGPPRSKRVTWPSSSIWKRRA
jgi:HD-GYP domain-containing protein (c-di-GMP phosphodiesterase class II)